MYPTLSFPTFCSRMGNTYSISKIQYQNMGKSIYGSAALCGGFSLPPKAKWLKLGFNLIAIFPLWIPEDHRMTQVVEASFLVRFLQSLIPRATHQLSLPLDAVSGYPSIPA